MRLCVLCLSRAAIFCLRVFGEMSLPIVPLAAQAGTRQSVNSALPPALLTNLPFELLELQGGRGGVLWRGCINEIP